MKQYERMMKNKVNIIAVIAIAIVALLAIGIAKNPDSFADNDAKGAIEVKVTVDGHTESVDTAAMDVDTFLQLQGIPVGEKDQINLAPDYILQEGDQLTITRITIKELVEKEEVDFEVKEVEDSSMDEGESVVETEGEKGEKEVTYQGTYADGKLVKKDLLSSEVTKEAKDKVVKIGTKKAVAATSSAVSYQSSGSVSYSGGNTITVTAVSYCLPGYTAIGLPVGRGIIAVDPSVIPLGTRVYVPGYGEAVAADTGSGIHGNKIDVWMPSLAEAYAWGARTVTITIL